MALFIALLCIIAGTTARINSPASASASAPSLWFPALLRATAPLPEVRRRALYYGVAQVDTAAPSLSSPESEASSAAQPEVDESSPYQYPRIITSSQETQHFAVPLTNPGQAALPALLASGAAPLALMPYPPGLPSLAAYRSAEGSATFRAMERFAAAWGAANSASLADYPFHKDPLHAWSRRYEYVWAAEGVRAAIAASPRHAQLGAVLEGTWPDAPAAPAPASEPPFAVLELDAQFTFFPQFLASRAGAQVRVLDSSASFEQLYSAQPPLPLGSEPAGSATRLAYSSGSALRVADLAALPAGSLDAIVWIGKLEAAQARQDLSATAAGLARLLRAGGRLLLTFNVGQPPIAMDAEGVQAVLGPFRAALLEDVTHGAPAELLGGGAARTLFTNHKARPAEFPTSTFSISCHVFVKE